MDMRPTEQRVREPHKGNTGDEIARSGPGGTGEAGRRSSRSPESPRRGRLDPTDWESFQAACHQVVDEVVERFREQGEGQVWRPLPDSLRERWEDGSLPRTGRPLEQVLGTVRDDILPHTLGNTHPRFFGWVHGSGTPTGALAEFLAGAMNANTGGRDHAPILVEEAVVGWMKELFGFPEEATGLLVSGTSLATIVGLAVARYRATDGRDRAEGVAGVAGEGRLVGYTTADGHTSLRDAFSLLGLGAGALRRVAMTPSGAMDVEALKSAVEEDRRAGRRPFVVVGTAGSVTCGAVDDLRALRRVAHEHELWLHVDGAFGAALATSPRLAGRLDGIEEADSLAFDFHKWFHVPYDAGCILVRDGALHRATFGGRPDYLTSLEEGPAAGDLWPCDLGPELSRGFRAFKVWMTLKNLGLDAVGRAVEANVRQAARLAARVRAEEELELLAPAELNIVCLRYRPEGADEASAEELNELNRDLLLELHRRGIAVPSPTRRGDAFGIRVCVCNHRTRDEDMDLLAEAVLELGRRMVPVG